MAFWPGLVKPWFRGVVRSRRDIIFDRNCITFRSEDRSWGEVHQAQPESGVLKETPLSVALHLPRNLHLGHRLDSPFYHRSSFLGICVPLKATPSPCDPVSSICAIAPANEADP
jgi:hypothetical protein